MKAKVFRVTHNNTTLESVYHVCIDDTVHASLITTAELGSSPTWKYFRLCDGKCCYQDVDVPQEAEEVVDLYREMKLLTGKMEQVLDISEERKEELFRLLKAPLGDIKINDIDKRTKDMLGSLLV